MASESMLRRVLGSLPSISENGYRIQNPEPLDSGMDLRLRFERVDSGICSPSPPGAKPNPRQRPRPSGAKHGSRLLG